MTQNQNEGFEVMIQNSIPNIPKSNYVSFLQLQTGINGTAVNFSFGRKAENLMFEKLNMIAGENCLKDCTKLKKKRLSGSAYGNLEKKKSIENLGVGKAKPKESKSNYKEQECYEVGAF